MPTPNQRVDEDLIRSRARLFSGMYDEGPHVDRPLGPTPLPAQALNGGWSTELNGAALSHEQRAPLETGPGGLPRDVVQESPLLTGPVTEAVDPFLQFGPAEQEAEQPTQGSSGSETQHRNELLGGLARHNPNSGAVARSIPVRGQGLLM